MGLNVDLTRMIGAPKEKTCPECGQVSKTMFDHYDIESPSCNPEPGKWLLHQYCGECDHEWKHEMTLVLPSKPEERDALFKAECSDRSKEIDGQGELHWHALTVGWAIAKGMNPDEAWEFATHIRYETELG